MVKLILWLLKNLIWGNDFTVDFSLTVSFEEAISYLRKGYFIHDAYNSNVLYFLINDTIYAIDIEKEKVTPIPTSISLKTDWRIVPMGKHVNIGDKDD